MAITTSDLRNNKVAFSVLARAGILGKVTERGFIPADVSWRKPSGEWVVGLERLDNLVEGLPNTVILPVGALSTLFVEEVQKYPSISLHWGRRVLVAGQDESRAWVEVEDQISKATTKMEADFVIGCDGGSSAVRKSISGSKFPGWTQTGGSLSIL
jgi:2-polyprenyl-6-methoxyphenol hydroxylase-like FAD-dependent oxidoreductase